MYQLTAAQKAAAMQSSEELKARLLARQRRACRHRFTVFSRVLCACGWMHTYCRDCDEPLDGPCSEDNS